MKYRFLKLGLILYAGLLLTGCASAPSFRYSATTNPPGAQLFKGPSPDAMSYYATTPFITEFSPISQGWSGQYFQAKMPGYEDSPLFQKPLQVPQEGITISLHFDLKPLAPGQRPNKITAPTPISGNSGNYMSPFTATGAIAPWAVKVEATADNGSDLAANVGGVVGQEVGRKALDFIPFGLGGMVGREVGSQAGRSATRTTIQPRIPSAEEARGTSDISFKTADELAVYMYARHSSHSEYARILALTKTVYPELAQVYAPAIARAAQSSDHEGQNQTASNQPANKKSAQEKLKSLQKLKEDGLISDIEFQAKRSKIIYASAMAQAGSSHNQTALNAPRNEKNPQERLKSLQKLKEDGLISEAEFQAKRNKILDAL